MYDCEQLRERLSDLGYETEENEKAILLNAIERAENTIMNNCNCEHVPEELRFVALDMAAGEYLLAAKCQGSDNAAVKSVTEGDVSVSFSDRTPTEELVDELLCRGREEMLAFRRIKW